MNYFGTLQYWLLTGIGATLFLAFVVVTILTLLDLVGIVKLPADTARPLRATLIVQFAVIAVGAMGALLAPDQIQTALDNAARQAGTISPIDPATVAVDAPVVQQANAPEIACATSEQAPLLYIQFSTEQQRSLAQAVQGDAQAAGFFAPGIELVERYTRPESQLRYFRQAEQDDAQAVASRLLAAGHFPADTSLVFVDADVRQCQFELWIGQAAG